MPRVAVAVRQCRQSLPVKLHCDFRLSNETQSQGWVVNVWDTGGLWHYGSVVRA